MIKKIIKELNDNFRKSFLGGRVMITQKFKCCLPKPKENYLTV